MRWYILTACMLAAACNFSRLSNISNVYSDIDTIIAVEAIPAKKPDSYTNCYKWIDKGKSALLQITVSENHLSGNLMYENAEKEKVTGRLNGIIGDSLINADYTFIQQGKTIVKEMIFKKVGEVLVKGTGETIINKGRIEYKNRAQIAYAPNETFSKINCSN